VKKSILFIVFLALSALSSVRAQTPDRKVIVRLDPSLDAVISPDAKLDVVKSGFGFTEGIVYVRHVRKRDLQGHA
jgi:hypothetical protein